MEDRRMYQIFWKCYQDGGKLKFKKYKIPTDRLHIGILTYIPEENIKEDNIEKP